MYKYAKHGMDAVEPSAYFESFHNPLNFAPLSERFLWNRYPAESTKYEVAPFDLCCPSMKGKLDKGICIISNQDLPSEAEMLRHKKQHKKKSHGEIEEKKSDEEQTKEGGEKFGYQATINEAKNILFFDNIFEILKSALVDA